MNPKAASERDAIVAELTSVIREIEAVAGEITSVRGVGTEKCADGLYRLANTYCAARNRLRGLP